MGKKENIEMVSVNHCKLFFLNSSIHEAFFTT